MVKKYKTIWFILLLTVTLFFIAYSFRLNDLNLLKTSDNQFLYLPYTDSSENGNSKVELLVDTAKSITMNYELLPGYTYPFTGFSCELSDDSALMDLSNYSHLLIKIKADKAKKIPVNLSVFCEGFSKLNQHNSLINYIFYIDYLPEKLTYEIPLEKFTVPNWWYTDNNVNDGTKLNCSFKKVKSVNIESCALLKVNNQDRIQLEGISFVSYHFWHWIILIVGFISALVIWIKIFTKSKKTIFVPYQSTPVQDDNKILENEILSYLSINYANSELSLPLISKETGIPENKITAIIKSETGYSFKQYLNNIRLAEAKRLLKEKQFSISEIAYKVGYNNVTHFNRVFKSETNLSPGDFRDND